MAGLMRRDPREEAAGISGRYGKLFEEWRGCCGSGPWRSPSGGAPLT
jgi:hypothetical protein